MVTIHTVENAKDVTTAMRGNFIKIVDKKSGSSSITFLNGKGKLLVTLDYDVQAAILDLHTDRNSQMRLAANFKTVVHELEEKIKAANRSHAPIVLQEINNDDSLQRWAVNTRIVAESVQRIKGLWAEARQ